jgi:hypothetical protein
MINFYHFTSVQISNVEMDDQYQFETAEEYKQDIRECSDPNYND